MLVNYRNKSTIGYSTDFAIIAVCGYILYLMNQTAGLVDPYCDAGRVNPMDEVSAFGYFVISSCTFVQTIIYPSDRYYRVNQVAWTSIMAVFLIGSLVEVFAHIPMESYLYVSLLNYCMIFKSVSTFQKWATQAWHNFKNKSVTGVSLWTNYIDIIGCSSGLI